MGMLSAVSTSNQFGKLSNTYCHSQCRPLVQQHSTMSPTVPGDCNTQIIMTRCDTSLIEEVSATLSLHCLASSLPPLLGIFNSGGVLADGVVTSQTAANIRNTFAPKLVSTTAMHHRVSGLPISQLLLFSSVASLFGSAGQASYAAANGALEGWITAASAQGLNGVAIQWGAWAAGTAHFVFF